MIYTSCNISPVSTFSTVWISLNLSDRSILDFSFEEAWNMCQEQMEVVMSKPLSTFFMCNLCQHTMAGEGVESLSLTLVMREEGSVGGGMVNWRQLSQLQGFPHSLGW